MAHKDEGITLRFISDEEISFVVFHDAAMANVDLEPLDAEDINWAGSHRVCSQLGSLVLITEKTALSKGHGLIMFVQYHRLEE